MTRPRNPLLVEIPLLVWLVLVWGALWGDFGVGNLVFGALLALLVTWVLYLPPVQLSGRFHAGHFLVFLVTFLWQVAKASFHIALIALVVGPRARSAVVAVPLRTDSDLILTATGHTMSLIPGSLVVEVDRSSSTLYFHALNLRTPEEAEAFRRSTLDIEAAWIRILGTREDLAALRDEDRRRGGDRRRDAAVGSPVTAQQQLDQGRPADDATPPTGHAVPRARPNPEEDRS